MEISEIYTAVADLGVTPLMIVPVGTHCYGESFGGDRVKYKVVYLESPMKTIYGGSLPKAHFTVNGIEIKLIRYADFIQHCYKGTAGYAEMLFMPVPRNTDYWENVQDHKETFYGSRQTLEESILYIDHGLMTNKPLVSRHILRKTEALLQFWEKDDIDFQSLNDCLVPEGLLEMMLKAHRNRLSALLHLSVELDTKRFVTLLLGPYRDMFQDKCRDFKEIGSFVTL